MIAKKLIAITLFALGSATLIFGYKLHYERSALNEFKLKYKDTEEQYRVIQKTLLGYTSFTGYSAILTKSLSEQMKFIGAKTKRRYMHQENIEKVIAGVKSYAALELIYDAEYVVGFDLSNGKFKLDANSKGLTLHLNKPEIVAEPAVTYQFTRILSNALLIDEKQETIKLQNKIPQIIGSADRKNEIVRDEAVIALCEKKIKEFIKNILINQYYTDIIPDIVIIYQN